ncbi:MAG TPA: hypothetical protein DEQ47_04665 [Solibacterales bacterium]|nr:hypothetical protein [Bryobacterales bacterium]
MFTKACLAAIVVLLVAILTKQHFQDVAHAQGGIEYKAVEADLYITPEGQANWRHETKYYSTQDALNEYRKGGWQLVTASYDRDRKARLIFMRK